MKKIAFPLVAALAVGACATTPSESADPSPSASIPASQSPATPSPTVGQADYEVAVTLGRTSTYIGVFPYTWVAFGLEGSPADWSFSFSDPSLVEFYADGVRNEYGTFAGVRTIKAGKTTVTATGPGGETVELRIEILP
jgi:hypothetical protein